MSLSFVLFQHITAKKSYSTAQEFQTTFEKLQFNELYEYTNKAVCTPTGCGAISMLETESKQMKTSDQSLLHARLSSLSLFLAFPL